MELLLILRFALLMESQVHLEDLSFLLQCLQLCVHRVPQPNLQKKKSEHIKELTYVVELGITHVADRVGDRVETCDLPLVTAALVADSTTTAFTNDFFSAQAEESHDGEL